jgi:UDP-N-acetylmuramoylalanine--D-glutamate ligase
VHPSSTIFALNALKNVDTVILGGQNRGYVFDELVEELAHHNVQHVILFPETGEPIGELLHAQTSYVPSVAHVDTMQEAVKYAFERTPVGGICLLSPGAPSYLLYPNLHERGLDFVSTIKQYAQKETTPKEAS